MDYPKKINELIDLTIDAINSNDGEQALLVLKEMRASFIVFAPPPGVTSDEVADIITEIPTKVRAYDSLYDGKCARCSTPHKAGDPIIWTARRGGMKAVYCLSCGKEYQ